MGNKKGQPKTNAARLLDKAGIMYELVSYEIDPSDLSATHVAEQLHEDPATVFKTITLRANTGELVVCVIPATYEVNLKKAAAAAKVKKLELLPLHDLLGATGYIRGGCSPIGMKRQFRTFIDISVQNHDRIYISAGQRGLQLHLNARQLITYVNATVSDLI